MSAHDPGPELARDPARDGRGWRVLRLAAVSGILVTGLVHFVLLRPLLDLHGADYAADKLLHMVVPVLAVAGWALFGPRPRISARVAGLVLSWPFAWLAWTLVVGAASGWYPYPFLDHREDGALGVGIASVGITVLFVSVLSVLAWVDARATPVPGQDWDHDRGHRPDRPTLRHRMRRV